MISIWPVSIRAEVDPTQVPRRQSNSHDEQHFDTYPPFNICIASLLLVSPSRVQSWHQNLQPYISPCAGRSSQLHHCRGRSSFPELEASQLEHSHQDNCQHGRNHNPSHQNACIYNSAATSAARVPAAPMTAMAKRSTVSAYV